MRVLITGVTGQDGWYLAELHVQRGDDVYALVRGQRTVTLPTGVLEVRGDLLDQVSLFNAVRAARPDVVYSLAAISSIGVSWGSPDLVANVTGLGVLRLLEAVRAEAPDASFVQASTADLFGDNPGVSTEDTPFDPRTPYGVAKLYAHQMCRTYRDAYDMKVSTAILYAHTSPRQSTGFIIPKVTRAAVAIAMGQRDSLHLGNVDVVRDWGWAPDYVRALPRLATVAGDFVVATGVRCSLKKLCETAFDVVDLSWSDHVKVDESFFRPTDVRFQVGQADKIGAELNWQSRVWITEIVNRMVAHALMELAR